MNKLRFEWAQFLPFLKCLASLREAVDSAKHLIWRILVRIDSGVTSIDVACIIVLSFSVSVCPTAQDNCRHNSITWCWNIDRTSYTLYILWKLKKELIIIQVCWSLVLGPTARRSKISHVHTHIYELNPFKPTEAFVQILEVPSINYVPVIGDGTTEIIQRQCQIGLAP